MSCFSKISKYYNFINKIMSNNLLNLCDKCFIICFLNSFCSCFMMSEPLNKKNSEDYDSHIIEIDKFNNA
jgi:hypothetical protein